MRIFIAIKPTGQLILGNYIGMLKNLKEIQNEKCKCFIFNVSAHSELSVILQNYFYIGELKRMT